jgi:hypothetical protein
MDDVRKKAAGRSPVPLIGTLFIGALSAAAIAVCKPSAETIAVDFDSFTVVRKIPGADRVPSDVVQALWIASFKGIEENDPPRAWASSAHSDRVYVSVVNAEGIEVDPPPAVMSHFRSPTYRAEPVSDEPRFADRKPGDPPVIRYTVGFPALRYDGRYEIVYGINCMPVCAMTSSLFLRRDGQGWRVDQYRWNSQL